MKTLKFYKKTYSILLIAGLFVSSLYSLDLTFRLAPSVFVPLEDSNTIFKTGFGGTLQADVDLFNFMTVGLEGNFTSVGLQSGKTSSVSDSSKALPTYINLLGGGAGLGFYYSPLSRLYLGLGGAFGVYNATATYDSKADSSAAGYYYRGYGELGFRVTPDLTICASGDYKDYRFYKAGSFMTGADIGLGVRYIVPVGKKSTSSISLIFKQDDSAFPLFMSAYRNFELGTLTLRNNESSEIRNVKVSFRCGKYTSSTYESANLSYVGKHSSVEIPLLADFSSEILKYSENGKLNGEVVVDYELLGKKKQTVQNVAIGMYNRNAFCWSDSTALAAFISSSTPEVQQLASIISGIETNNLIQGMNKNFQMAAAVYEGLRLFGIKQSEDKVTPYLTFHNSSDLDSIQYPAQTMAYLSGDLDDIGILLASCLESVGVPTGYMLLDDDFIVLVGTNIKKGTEKNHFKDDSGLVVDDENIYFGLSMADFNKGFVQSRKTAIEKISAAKLDEENPHDYVGTHSAWCVYSPAVFSGNSSNFEYPSKESVENAAKTSITEYINSDLSYIIEQAKRTGDSNKLGVAYLRSGKITEAKAEFSKSKSVKCMNNLASCYMVEKNYEAAAAQYKEVLAKEPDNKIALKGLDSANEKLGL